MKKKIDSNYNGEYETQLFTKVMVERSGFIPRSIQIQKMAVQGELNKIINDFENDRISGRKPKNDVPLSVLGHKNLTRSEMIRMARNRFEEIKGVYFNDLSKSEKEQALLYSKSDLSFQTDHAYGSSDNSNTE